jgi:acyl carrier protein
MDRSKFMGKLSEVLQVDSDMLTEDFKLDDEIWDSLAVMSAIAAIDEVYGVTVPAKPLKNCINVRDIFPLIETQLKQEKLNTTQE